jgi:putative component of toxin-antitoxin plasmid stabilization module
MPKYSLILSPNISSSTKIPVFELCIDGSSLFDNFIGSIEGNKTFENELAGAIRNLELASNLLRLPKTKFREIKQQKLKIKFFEAKYGAIRIYHFQEKNTGRIIVLGGLKNNQQIDIKSAIRTIKNYQDENN